MTASCLTVAPVVSPSLVLPDRVARTVVSMPVTGGEPSWWLLVALAAGVAGVWFARPGRGGRRRPT